MRNFAPLPFILIFTYPALLLLLHILVITPIPSDASAVPFSIRPPLISFPRQAVKPYPPKPSKKETTRRWIGEEEGKDVPLVRIFPNGTFSPFTTEETIEFYILRNAQGQGPDPRDPPLEHPAPPGVELEPKPSKEGSVYDESRTCDSSGEWCNMPVEGSQLIAGIGIGSCTYFEPEGIWGKTVTYLAC